MASCLLTETQRRSLLDFVSSYDSLQRDHAMSDATKSLAYVFAPYVVLSALALVLDRDPELLAKWREYVGGVCK